MTIWISEKIKFLHSIHNLIKYDQIMKLHDLDFIKDYDGNDYDFDND